MTVSTTEAGEALREKALVVNHGVAVASGLSRAEAVELRSLLDSLVTTLDAAIERQEQ